MIDRTAVHTSFPFALILIVIAFLLVQNRIDRRDPKLSLAAVFADEGLEFTPANPPPQPATKTRALVH